MNQRPDYDLRSTNFYGTLPAKFSDYAMRASADEYQIAVDQPVRGILRKNPEQRPALYLNGYDYYTNNDDRQVVITKSKKRKESKWQAVYDRLVRPCLAEFFVLCVVVFVYKHVESQISERQVPFITRILLLSAVDSALVGIFMSAFETVQINPAITVAQLFSMNTPWYLCTLLLFMQFGGACAGISLFYLAHTGMFPALPKLVIDMEGDFTGSVTELIICQFVGTLSVCISFLMATQSVGTSRLYIARLARSPFGVVSAVALSSFLSLLHSNISWNPVEAFALSAFHFFKSGPSSISWQNHYVYWLGPTLGSLAACFLFRFILAPRDKRIQICQKTPDYAVC